MFILVLSAWLGFAATSLDRCKPLFADYNLQVSGQPSQAPIQNKSDFRIMSWNLNDFFVKSAGFGTERVSQKNPSPDTIKAKNKQKISRIRALIERYLPDVLVLQEVVGSHSTRSLDHNRQYEHITDTPVDGRGLQTVFMVNQNLFVDAQLYQPKMSIGATELKRGLPTLLLRQKDQAGEANLEAAPDFIVIGVHLRSQSRVYGQSMRQNKLDEAELIYRAAQELQERYPDSPLVVTGDFNIHLPKVSAVDQIRVLMQEALDGKVEEAKPEEATYSHFVQMRGRGPNQAIFAGGKTIDASLHNSAAQAFFVGSSVIHYLDSSFRPKMYVDRDGNPSIIPQQRKQALQELSDHKPIIMEYDFRR